MSKALLILTNPFADIRVGLPLETIWLSILCDLALGVANFVGATSRIVYFCNVAVFLVFALFNLLRLASGEVACACGGVIEIPTWLMLIVDLVVVGYLVCSKYRRNTCITGAREMLESLRACRPGVFAFLSAVGALVVFVVAVPLLGFGSVRELSLHQPSIVVWAPFQNDLVAGQQRQIEIEFRNQSEWPAKIVGVQGSCSCLSIVNDLKAMHFPANAIVRLPIWVTPRDAGNFHQRLSLFLDHPERFRIDVDVVGFVK